MKTAVPLERVEQEALVEWLMYHPILKEHFHKNDNEGKRSALQGYRLKKLGLRAGVSDLFICYPSKSRAYPGLYLEVKRNKKYSPSEMNTVTWIEQVKFQERVKSVGYAAFFCYGWVDGKDIIERYLES